MKFIITRTSGRRNEHPLPEDEKIKRVEINENFHDVVFERKFSSLTELMNWIHDIAKCECVISGNEIEIYDDYRE